MNCYFFLSDKTKYYKSQTMEQWQLYSQYFISQYICLLVLMYLFVLKEQRNCISRVVSVSRIIILFNTGLYKSPFSTNSFGKLVFRISPLFELCPIRRNLHKLNNICRIIVYIVGARYSVFLFSFISKKRFMS